MIEQALLRMKDLAQYLGMTKRNIYNLEKNDPTFPKKIVLSKRCVGFTKNSIDQWMLSKIKR
jgi:predicted DNA-binding transcriptional regulator AlpA